MNFHILTLFPEMVMDGLNTSIIGRAVEAGQISIEAVNIRDFSQNKHKKVDDYTYGGGAGMLMQAQPVFDAYQSVAQTIAPDARKRVIYVTPQGLPFNQTMAEDFAASDDLVFLCGHYEGIDERVLEEVVTDYVSIGDYVLTGGELAAMVMIDAISRLVPGVLHNEISAETESFHGDLLEYPQYSRPEVWHDKVVPEVLLSGNQKNIDKWRLEQSIERTRTRRPDLYEKYQKLQECRARLMKQKLLHMDMIELINRGNAVYVVGDEGNILLQDKMTGICYYSHIGMVANSGSAEKTAIGMNYGNGNRNNRTGRDGYMEFIRNLPNTVANRITRLVIHQADLAEEIMDILHMQQTKTCFQAVYTPKERLSISGLYRADGQPTEKGLVIRRLEDAECGFGAYVGEELLGTILLLTSGSMSKVVLSDIFRTGESVSHDLANESQTKRLPDADCVARALETYLINHLLELGRTPYMYINADRQNASELLEEQMNLGLYIAKTSLVWAHKQLNAGQEISEEEE